VVLYIFVTLLTSLVENTLHATWTSYNRQRSRLFSQC